MSGLLDAVDWLGEVTGLPTYRDVGAAVDELGRALGWLDDDESISEEVGDRVEDLSERGRSWWDNARILIFVWATVDWLLDDHSLEFEWEVDLGKYEKDSVLRREREEFSAAVPQAARTGDPMAHGPHVCHGRGADRVRIAGKAALRAIDQVKCPAVNPDQSKHVAISFEPPKHSIFVEGSLLLRAGDALNELIGGPNPIVAGCPTVIAGPPAPSVVVEYQQVRPLRSVLPIDRFGIEGGKVKFTGRVGLDTLEPYLRIKAEVHAGDIYVERDDDDGALRGELQRDNPDLVCTAEGEIPWLRLMKILKEPSRLLDLPFEYDCEVPEPEVTVEFEKEDRDD